MPSLVHFDIGSPTVWGAANQAVLGATLDEKKSALLSTFTIRSLKWQRQVVFIIPGAEAAGILCVKKKTIPLPGGAELVKLAMSTNTGSVQPTGPATVLWLQ